MFTDHVSLLNEDGNWNHLGNYSGYYIHSNGDAGFYSIGGSSPAEISIMNDKIFIMSGSYKFYMSHNSDYLNHSVRNFIRELYSM